MKTFDHNNRAQILIKCRNVIGDIRYHLKVCENCGEETWEVRQNKAICNKCDSLISFDEKCDIYGRVRVIYPVLDSQRDSDVPEEDREYVETYA